LFREHSVSREAALIALRERELVWEIVYTSPSLTGIRAAAMADLAITPLPAAGRTRPTNIAGGVEAQTSAKRVDRSANPTDGEIES